MRISMGAKVLVLLALSIALLIGVEAVDHSGLVAGDENSFAATDGAQDTGVAEIGVDEGIARAVGFVRAHAGEVVGIAFGELARP